MRYRPFTATGQSISALSLALAPGLPASQAYKLICRGLENGLNAFTFVADDEGAAEALRHAVAAVGRRVLILMLRLKLDGTPFEEQVHAAVQTSGATFLDAAILDRPPSEALASADFSSLDALRRSRRVTRLGLACEADDAEPFLRALDFDILATRYNVCSGWPERNLLKHVGARGMTALGYGYEVASEEAQATAAAPKGLARLLRRTPQTLPKAYDFLSAAPGWSRAQITLGYALTEPALASIFIDVREPDEIDNLALAVERELPTGVSAQIEIARFAAGSRSRVA